MANKLPLQGAAQGKYWSLPRDTQLRTVLETMFEALFGHGVVTGGAVTKAGDTLAEIAAGTVLFVGGVTYTLAEAVTAAVLGTPGTSVYLWADIARTPASQDNPLAEDAYTLATQVTASAVAPGASYTPMAIISLDGSGHIESIDFNPAGKYLTLDRFGVAVDTKKARVDEGDQEGFLWEKFIAGDGLTLSKVLGVSRQIRIDAANPPPGGDAGDVVITPIGPFAVAVDVPEGKSVIVHVDHSPEATFGLAEPPTITLDNVAYQAVLLGTSAAGFDFRVERKPA